MVTDKHRQPGWFLLFFLILWLDTAIAQDFKVIGYLPTYRFSYQDDISYTKLTHLNLAFANPDMDGNMSFGNVETAPIVTIAHNANVKVFASLGGGYLEPAWETAWNSLMLPQNRPAFIHKIIQFLAENDFDGADMDIEWQFVTDLYSGFVLELKDSLAAHDYPLSVALPGSYRYPEISAAALNAFDWVNMMIYDLTGPWDPSNPGQHSPMWWTISCIDYWMEQGVPADRLTLGVPFYGYDFSVNPVSSVTFRSMVQANPAYAFLDQVDQKFYNGINTIAAKTELALAEVSGIMIWEIGQDAFGTISEYSLLMTIDQTINNATSITEIHGSALTIFPNPVGDVLQVQTEQRVIEKIQISDMQGRILLETIPGASGQTVISTNQLVAGFYVLTAFTDQGKLSGKLVKS